MSELERHHDHGYCTANVPLCAFQQQGAIRGSARGAVNWVITAANGKRSIDTVTVTVGGKAPTRLRLASQFSRPMTPPVRRHDHCASGTHHELLLMWKPVRLQGVGAPPPSSTQIRILPAFSSNDCGCGGLPCSGCPLGVPDGYNLLWDGWSDFTPTTFQSRVIAAAGGHGRVGCDSNGNLANNCRNQP